MANYKYVYDKSEQKPADFVEYKHCTVYPNQVLALGILSFVFSGWLGIIFALYALQKEKIFRVEHDGETCKMVRIGKILAIISLALTAALALTGAVYVIVMNVILYNLSAEESLAFIRPVLSMLGTVL